jgi:hypothetical protein
MFTKSDRAGEVELFIGGAAPVRGASWTALCRGMGSTPNALKHHEAEPQHVRVPTRAWRSVAEGGETREANFI